MAQTHTQSQTFRLSPQAHQLHVHILPELAHSYLDARTLPTLLLQTPVLAGQGGLEVAARGLRHPSRVARLTPPRLHSILDGVSDAFREPHQGLVKGRWQAGVGDGPPELGLGPQIRGAFPDETGARVGRPRRRTRRLCRG